MPSVLEELYHGNVGFDSRHYGANSPFVKAARVQHDSMEALMATLGNSEKELFEQYCEARGDIEGITRYDTYAEALKFGILLMAELLVGDIGAD